LNLNTNTETPVLSHTKYQLSATVKLLPPVSVSQPEGWVILIGSEQGRIANEIEEFLLQAADLHNDAFRQWKLKLMKFQPIASLLGCLYGTLRCTWSLYRAVNAESHHMIMACGPSPGGKAGPLPLDCLKDSGLAVKETGSGKLVLKVQTMSLKQLQEAGLPPFPIH
jgi:hypothetical protein